MFEQKQSETCDLINKYEKRLLDYAQGILKNHDQAKDAVQETFIAFLRTSKKIQNTEAWLYGVCRNQAVQIIKKEKRFESFDDKQWDAIPMPNGCPRKYAEMQEISLYAQKLIEALKPVERQIFLLAVQEELSYKKISQITNKSISNVGAVICHIRQKISAQLKERFGENVFGGDNYHESRLQAPIPILVAFTLKQLNVNDFTTIQSVLTRSFDSQMYVKETRRLFNLIKKTPPNYKTAIQIQSVGGTNIPSRIGSNSISSLIRRIPSVVSYLTVGGVGLILSSTSVVDFHRPLTHTSVASSLTESVSKIKHANETKSPNSHLVASSVPVSPSSFSQNSLTAPATSTPLTPNRPISDLNSENNQIPPKNSSQKTSSGYHGYSYPSVNPNPSSNRPSPSKAPKDPTLKYPILPVTNSPSLPEENLVYVETTNNFILPTAPITPPNPIAITNLSTNNITFSVSNTTGSIATFRFKGVVEGQFGSVSPKTPFHGAITYDLSQSDTSPGNSRGDYTCLNFSLTVGNETVAGNPEGVINMYDNATTPYSTDLLVLYTLPQNENQSLGGVPIRQRQIVFEDIYGRPFNSTALSTNLDNLNLFYRGDLYPDQTPAFLDLSYLDTNGPFPQITFVKCPITNVTVEFSQTNTSLPQAPPVPLNVTFPKIKPETGKKLSYKTSKGFPVKGQVVSSESLTAIEYTVISVNSASSPNALSWIKAGKFNALQNSSNYFFSSDPNSMAGKKIATGTTTPLELIVRAVGTNNMTSIPVTNRYNIVEVK